MAKVVIFGSAGHGKVILDILLESKTEVLGFIDEDINKIGQRVDGFEVLGDWSYLEGKNFLQFALGIGNNGIRKKIFDRAKIMGFSIASAIHPRAIVSRNTKIGEGVVIMPGAVINPGVVLEEGVVVNTGATVDHDCYLERFCQIWPGAHLAGSVRVGESSYVGTGASVIQNTSIGGNSIVGAGAAVVTDIPRDVVAVGVPARVLKENNKCLP